MSMCRGTLRAWNLVQKRGFRARGGKEPLPPPYPVKTSFDYSETEPLPNWERSAMFRNWFYHCLLEGSNYVKYNSLRSHYDKQEYFVNNNHEDYYMNFGGMYGPYWPAHMGGGYLKFLKRRSDLPGTYKHKSPLTNLWRRKLDERGIFCEFPRAQDYQLVSFWLLGTVAAVIFFGQVGNIKAHFNNAKPAPPEDDYPPRMNLPFYVYIMHSIPSPGFEE